MLRRLPDAWFITLSAAELCAQDAVVMPLRARVIRVVRIVFFIMLFLNDNDSDCKGTGFSMSVQYPNFGIFTNT